MTKFEIQTAFLFFWLWIAVSPALATKTVPPLNEVQCLTSAGKAVSGSHCVCYRGKKACEDGTGICSVDVCEKWTCSNDQDCAQISAKCVENFCKE